MNVQHIISEALIEYDNAMTVIRYLLKNTRYEGTKTNIDSQRTKFKFIDIRTGEVVLDTEVEILAVFYDKLSVWSWAWSLTGLTNAENYFSKEILLYALKIGSELSYIKSILTTSRGIIKDLTQVDINLAIGSSIIKQPYIYPYIYPIDNGNLIYYSILLNKTELDKLHEKLSNESDYKTNDDQIDD